MRLANYLDKHFVGFDPSQYLLSRTDLLRWRKRRLGFVLLDEVLWLDMKSLWSCRTRISNLAVLPGKLEVLPRRDDLPLPLDEPVLIKYFMENIDNPYGIWNYLQQLATFSPPSELTQLPPLNYPKSAEKQRRDIEKMREQALPVDMVFTFDRSSGLAHLIRKYDCGMWSHVAMVNEAKDLTEATTEGVVTSSFFRLSDPSLDVGLYRLAGVAEEERQKVLAAMHNMSNVKRFNWRGVIRIFLQKRFGIPYRRTPAEITPNELIYANCFHLVCYA